MDGDAAHLRNDAEILHGNSPAPLVAVEEGQQAIGGVVHPVQPAGDPSPGLVEVDRWGVLQLLSRSVQEEPEATSCFLNHRGERAGRHVDAEHVVKELCHAVIGEVLVDRQVASERPDPGSVTTRGAREGRDLRFGLTSARTSPALDPVLGDHCTDRRHVEDLASIDPHHLGT
jgi:hypothetical protein